MNDKTLSAIQKTAKSYGSVPFWSWNDDLEPEELRRQIRAMDKIGMNGFFMHARGGLETEYLSDRWFECINACVDEAKKLGMDAWSYDENGWPSGFAGGLLLKDEDNFARYLTHAEEETYPTDDAVLGVYKIEDGKCRKATSADSAPFCVVREAADSSYVDVLRQDIIAKFIEVTHEEYKRRVGEDFGGVMPGFFTDEPQYYRYASPWSKKLPEEFMNRFGYSIEEIYPAVFWDFEGCEAYRYDYYLLLHELFMKNFAKQIYDWCEENGCQQTGHAIDEGSLGGQVMCCGGVMPFYQYEHVPGVDYLGRGIQTDLLGKQLGSACAQLGRKKALSETFACAGWDVSPRELKRIAEMQYAGGVNLMCQHLYPYSERGQRKRDYPLHYSEHSPWYDKMGDFDRHFTNLGAMLGAGEEYTTTLVIHPVRAAYRVYKRHLGHGSCGQLDADLRVLMQQLGDAQVPYHFGDEGMMEEMASVEGAKIRVGLCSYDYIIVPKMETLTANTVKLLREFAANGGKILFAGDVPGEIDARPADLSDLASSTTLEEITAASAVITTLDGANVPALRQRIRVMDGRKIIFTANITAADHYGVRMNIKNCAGAAGVCTDTFEKFQLTGEKNADGSLTVALDFPGSYSIVIIEDEDAQMLPIPASFGAKPVMQLPEIWKLSAPLTNALTIDYAAISKDGGATWTEDRPIERVRDELLRERYEGNLLLRYPFTVDVIPATAEIVWENPGVKSVRVNGVEVQANGYLHPDKAFSRADVASLLRLGVNGIVLEYDYYQQPLVYDVLFGDVMESLRNCLNFDTEIECVYVRGDFRVGMEADKCEDGEKCTVLYTGAFPLVAPRAEIAVRDMVRDGLPFYGGAVEAECTVGWKPGDATVFRPDGRFAAVDVWVNGAYAGMVFFNNELDLAEYLREGENTLRIRIVNALRNTAGPHHRADVEPFSVGPVTFSFEKQWKDGKCDAYLTRYAFVKYGI